MKYVRFKMFISHVKDVYCMLHATVKVCMKYIRFKIFISHVKGLERNKNKHNRLDLTHLCVMSKVLKVLYLHNQYTSIKRNSLLFMVCTNTGNFCPWRCPFPIGANDKKFIKFSCQTNTAHNLK